MSGTTWLPSDLMDEMIPPPRNSPDDWIGSLDDGAAAIIAGIGALLQTCVCEGS